MTLYAVIVDGKFRMIDAKDCIDVYRQISEKQSYICIECTRVADKAEGKEWYRRKKKAKLIFRPSSRT